MRLIWRPPQAHIDPKVFAVETPSSGHFRLCDYPAALKICVEKDNEGFEFWEATTSSWKYALSQDILRLRGMKTYFLIRHQSNVETPFAGHYITRMEESLREWIGQNPVIDVENGKPAALKKVSYACHATLASHLSRRSANWCQGVWNAHCRKL